MKSTYTSIILMIFLLSFNAQATYKSQICSSADPKTELLRAYGIGKVYSDFSDLLALTKLHPLNQMKAVKKALDKNLTHYTGQLAAIEKRNKIFLSLPRPVQASLYSLINSYSVELKELTDQIGYEVTDLDIPAELKPIRKEELTNLSRLELLKNYRPQMVDLLELNNDLDQETKDFLIKWTLDFIPREPAYVWSDSANTLNRYLWDLIYDFKPIKNTGKVAGGSYWVETNVVSETPGLNLNIAPRDSTDPSKNANIRFRLSPFSGKLENYICDFEKNPDHCTLMTLSEWCSSN